MFKVQTGRCFCGFNTVSMILNSLDSRLDVSEQQIVDEASRCEEMGFKSIETSGIDLEQCRRVAEYASTTHLGENMKVTKYIGNDD